MLLLSTRSETFLSKQSCFAPTLGGEATTSLLSSTCAGTLSVRSAIVRLIELLVSWSVECCLIINRYYKDASGEYINGSEDF